MEEVEEAEEKDNEVVVVVERIEEQQHGELRRNRMMDKDHGGGRGWRRRME